MDIKVLKEILTTLDQAGITQAIFEPTEGGTLIRGANKDKNILIFDTMKSDLVELPMGVQSITGLLSRVNLFDEEKAKIVVEKSSSDDMISSITVKQGRRKASFRLGNPLLRKGGLSVPTLISENIDEVQELTFSEEYVKYLSSVISSMGYTAGNKAERTLGLDCDGGTVNLRISDGEDDSFVDVLEDTDVELESQASWEVAPFERMLKQSMEVNPGKKAKFGISENHVAVFDLQIIRALVIPLH